MLEDYTSKGTPLGVGAPGPLNGFAVDVETASDDGPYETITYWQCTDGHLTIHTGHTDAKTMMSVYDGSVETTIPCGSSDSPMAGIGWRYEVHPGSFLASVPPDFVDRVDVLDSTFVVAAQQDPSADELPPLSIWSTAACDGGHVVMHYGHEDSVAGTSVYDGSVTTSIPC